MCWIIVILFLALTIFLVWASADISSNIYLKSVCKGDTEDKVITLTFDDGPDEIMTPRVLDVLKRHDVKATFFLIGDKVDKYPHIAKRIVDEGHIVGNHTYSHSGLFPLSSSTKVKDELQRCNDAIYEAVGLRTKLFRPPFGVTNPIIGKYVRQYGFKTIGWSIRSLDTVKGREKVLKKVVRQLHPGAIILLHDRCENVDILLENIITSSLEKGFGIVSLDEMLKLKAYED